MTVPIARTGGPGLPSIDVQDFIDASRLTRFQALVVFLCFLTVAADGFDTAAITSASSRRHCGLSGA